ncbi:MAG: c-type cytochrome [Acidobacteriota bacterium]
MKPILITILTLFPLVAQRQYLSSDVENGSRLYRTNCYACHGPEGASIPGVNFQRGQFKRATSDDDLFRIIASGIPGTAMPPTAVNDGARFAMVAYLRSMQSAMSAVGSGDAARGKALFEGKGGCASCHRVRGIGSRIAPDLSEVGAIRTAAYLERSLVVPAESVLPEHKAVRLVTRQGTTISGRRLNEDTHTIQIIDLDQRMISYLKSDLRELILLNTTSMPSFQGKFTAAEMTDMVTYLLSLKGE